MERITEAQVQRAMELTAAALGKPWARGNTVYRGSPFATPLVPVGKLWTRDGNRNRAFIGAWHLGFAYGGVTVEEMVSEGGGVTHPVAYGHVPKRELFNQLTAMRRGAELRGGSARRKPHAASTHRHAHGRTR